MAVGPSAPPIIPIEPHWAGVNPHAYPRRNVANIPIWAAAPRIMVFGLEIRGPKSVVAPIPKNIKHGYISYLIPR